MGELQMRRQLAQQDLADQIKQAQLAHTLAQTAALRSQTGAAPASAGQGSRWRQYLAGQGGGGAGTGAGAQRSGRAGKAAAYVAGSGDVQNDPATDNFNQIRTDFDAQHGKGAFDLFSKNVSNLKPDGKGNLVLTGPDGNPIVNEKTELPSYSIPAKDADFWMQRYNAARIRGGQDYLGNLPDGTNQNSGAASGQSQVNPISVRSNLELRSLPFGTWIQLPDGSVRQKIQQASGATTGQNQAAQVAQTSDQSQDQEQQRQRDQEEQRQQDQEEQQQQEDQEDQAAAQEAGTTSTTSPDQSGALASAQGGTDEGTAQNGTSASAQGDMDEDALRRQLLAQNASGAGTLYSSNDLYS
jgi:hypothetical protein